MKTARSVTGPWWIRVEYGRHFANIASALPNFLWASARASLEDILRPGAGIAFFADAGIFFVVVLIIQLCRFYETRLNSAIVTWVRILRQNGRLWSIQSSLLRTCLRLKRARRSARAWAIVISFFGPIARQLLRRARVWRMNRSSSALQNI